MGIADAYTQAVQSLCNIETALKRAGAGLQYVVNLTENWEAVGPAHGAFFGEIGPACTMLEVSRLIDPQMLVEIEAEAIIEDPSASRP